MKDEFNEQTNHMRFLPDEQAKRTTESWIQTLNDGLSAVSTIHFTPGVPTEDGWYVVKVTDPRGEYYAIAKTLHGMLMSIVPDINGEHTILSHAKLPEL